MLKSKFSTPSRVNANVQCFSMVSLKVDNLTYRTNDRDLEYLFEKYGKVIIVSSVLDRIKQVISFLDRRYLHSKRQIQQGEPWLCICKILRPA